ncbi:hypothetical protein B5M47_02890 [candidate division CPR3 bacterium 4484_211]|uniref:LysM domain-containing protein n=1 Tax=candidate division CPR3 bacterium 4484_211 TaxID=1968527 RepID=A0A1W9NZ85_UNCC3|nr:MAG: hypothetical protein B5M47_02890 [candidate division CPR3 bacterium 4484_211]
MLSQPAEEIPIWKDFLNFSICLKNQGGNFLFAVFAALKSLRDEFVWRFSSTEAALVGFLMRRRNRWLVDKLNFTPVVGVVASLVLFAPGLEVFSAQEAVEKILSADDAVVVETHDILVQNNITVTTAGKGQIRAEIINYTVRPGDTLYEIGRRFNVTVESLAYINNIGNQNYLSPGDSIKIPPVSGIIHRVRPGETVSSVARKWGVSPQVVVDANWLDEPYLLSVGQELVVPQSSIPTRLASSLPGSSVSGGAATADSGLQLVPVSAGGTGSLGMPAVGTLTQYFSWWHPAIDVANRCGTPIVAADSGTIIFASWWVGGGGNSVMIDHGNGYVTKYAHLSGFARRSGTVSKGEVIGYMGATGRAYGCHVHFVVERNGRAVNPLSIVR